MLVPDPWIIAAAMLLDLLLGDPRGLPHPVCGIGRLIGTLEPPLRHLRSEYLGGILLLVGTVGISAAVAWGILKGAALIAPWAGAAAAIWICYTCLAARSLHGESGLVAEALAAGDLPLARQRLAMIVGRDTADLDEAEIWRAAIETVAENTADAIVAPLFWMALGGPLAAVAFKAVSTLDSMVGYRNERYLLFGRASARMDDLLNFIPARLTALLMVLCAPLAGLSATGASSIALRDRLKHPSPNSAHGEAAAAGALGVRLGGSSSYGGVPSFKHYLGEPLAPLDRRAYDGMIRLMYCCTGLMAAAAIATAAFWRAHVPGY